MIEVSPESLDPYPGEFLKEDLGDRISHSNQMLAIEYLSHEDTEGAQECMKNIYLAATQAVPKEDPFQGFIQHRKNWKDLMEYFSSEKTARDAQAQVWKRSNT
jgi:hypothetical protein